MFGIFQFILSAAFISLSAETLKDLEKLSPNPLYFSIPISEYVIKPNENCQNGKECSVDLEVTFETSSDSSVSEIPVVTDRPVRKTSHVSLDEIINYTTPATKTGLVFTLDISQNGKVSPANFTIDSVTYDKNKHMLKAKSQMYLLDTGIVDELNKTGEVKGDRAVLNIEG